MFSCLTAVCALASTITSVVLADAWGEPPEACDQYSRYYKSLDCDHNHLEGTNGTAAVSQLPHQFALNGANYKA